VTHEVHLESPVDYCCSDLRHDDHRLHLHYHTTASTATANSVTSTSTRSAAENSHYIVHAHTNYIHTELAIVVLNETTTTTTVEVVYRHMRITSFCVNGEHIYIYYITICVPAILCFLVSAALKASRKLFTLYRVYNDIWHAICSYS